jgi:hypothetical protein
MVEAVKKPLPRPPADEPFPSWLKRQAKFRKAREEFMKRNGITADTLEEEPEGESDPEVISPREIDGELDELLG